MPNDRPMIVSGFVVYREYGFLNPHSGEYDLTRDEHDCMTEDEAKKTLEDLKQEFPGDTVYYEVANISI